MQAVHSRLLGAMAVFVICSLSSPVTSQERWVCAYPNFFDPQHTEIISFTVLGDTIESEIRGGVGLQFKILQNNDYSIIAVRSMSKISGNKMPRMGADVVLIEKATGKYRYSPVYMGVQGDASVYGNCRRN